MNIPLNVPVLLKELAQGHKDGLPADALHDALLEAEMPYAAAHVVADSGHKADHCRVVDCLINNYDYDFPWETQLIGIELHGRLGKK